jgi:2-aminoethylphosphonate dioxygenase
MATTAFIPSAEQVTQFKRDGYLLLRAEEHGLVKPEDLQAWTDQVRSWPTEKGKWMPYHEVNTDGSRQLMRTENFVDYHPEFHALLCGEDIARILKTLSGDVS